MTRSFHKESEEEVSLLATKQNTRQPNMATKKGTSKFATQRTFDSSDDLLENEEALDSDDEGNQREARHENSTKVTSVWDCRAIYWPPHSVKTMAKSGLDFFQSPFLIMEVLFLGVFLYLCYILPGELSAPKLCSSQRMSFVDLTLHILLLNLH